MEAAPAAGWGLDSEPELVDHEGRRHFVGRELGNPPGIPPHGGLVGARSSFPAQAGSSSARLMSRFGCAAANARLDAPPAE